MDQNDANQNNPKDLWKQYVPEQIDESWKDHQESWKQEVNSWEPLFEEAKELHQKAVDGDEKAVKEVFKQLKEIRKKAPSNNLVEAYYGSTIALLGRDASDTMDRFRLVRKGMKILDSAVQKEPNNTEIRILRGYVSYNIPEMYFQRTSTAIEDFEFLISQYEKDSSIFSENMFWKLLYDLGVSYKRVEKPDNSKRTFVKLLKQEPSQEYKELVEHEGINEDDLSELEQIESPNEETTSNDDNLIQDILKEDLSTEEEPVLDTPPEDPNQSDNSQMVDETFEFNQRKAQKRRRRRRRSR